MNKYTAQEQAYKNGFELGLKVKQEKYGEQFIKGFNEAIKPKKDKWKDNLLNTFLKGGYE